MAMEKNEDRLIALLDYLIKHNVDHTDELKEIRDQVQNANRNAVRNHLNEAVKSLEQCTESLAKALSELREI